MTTLNDYVALQADHERLRIAASQALALLELVPASPTDAVHIETVRRDLRDALGGEQGAPDADEKAPITREYLIGLFGDHMPMEAAMLIRDNIEGRTIPEIRAALRRMAAERRIGRTVCYTHDRRDGRHYLNIAPPVRIEPPYAETIPVKGFAYIGRTGAVAGIELSDTPPWNET